MDCAKILVTVGIFLCSLIGVGLPLLSWKQSNFVIGNLFSGGILISAAVVHFLGDANEDIEDAIEAGSLPEFPWAEMVLASGFLFMVTLETSVAAFVEGRVHNDTAEDEEEEAVDMVTAGRRSLDSCDGNVTDKLPTTAKATTNGKSGPPRNGCNDLAEPLTLHCEGETEAAHDHANHVLEMFANKDISGGYAAFLALTVHSILEGIGLGTQTDLAGLVSIAAAIVCHKGFAAFAMGCALAKIGNRSVYMRLCAIFCLATPVGIGVGMAVDKASADGAATGLLNAFCGGTLLFVATDEIIAPNLAAPSASLWLKMVAIWLGFAVMSVMAIWA